jgi:hypothetical protein
VPSVRRFWLTLGPGAPLYLTDLVRGYGCIQLDLGYPEIREVVNNRPDTDGTFDRTNLFGARAVTAEILAWPGGESTIDDVVRLFGPYLDPRSRPVLHVTQFSDQPDVDLQAPEKTLTLRAARMASPMTHPKSRSVQMAWVAPDPILRDVTVNTAIARSGSSTSAGRTYPLAYPRAYPIGGSISTIGVISTPGDVPVRPLFRVFGPITNPRIYVPTYYPLPVVDGPAGFIVWNGIIDAGHYVEFDTIAKVALYDGDPAQPVTSSIDWGTLVWPVIRPIPGTGRMQLLGDSTTNITQAQAIWQDGYLL